MDLRSGWEVASAPPGSHPGPEKIDALDWRPATVPGTAAAAVGADGRDFDAEDWWFRCRLAAPELPDGGAAILELDGIATVSDVFLNGRPVLHSESMWREHRLEVTGGLRPENELIIACRALAPLLGVRRRPGARWRTRVVNHTNLRWYRTMVFGRSPGFAAGPAPVGPWRPVRLATRGPAWLEDVNLRTYLDGEDGVVKVRARGGGELREAELRVGEVATTLRVDECGELAGALLLPAAEPWWPHTHGQPALHQLELSSESGYRLSRRIGFRRLGFADDIREDGLDLHVNDVPVFARGAVWTPPDLVSLAPARGDLRALLERVRDTGMNMLRIPGTAAYESPLFHDLCDELGILVWQDLMFANLDYPLADPEFAALVQDEARQVLARLNGRPSLAVVCGNSEVEQTPAMMGLDPALGRDPMWEETIPRLVSEAGLDCAYVPSTPCGGDLPFHPDRGVTHYFGVSGYFGPLQDARRALVRFASECLAFAHVPDEVSVPVHHPQWKIGVQRDAGTGWDIGAGWDFDDVRDHYLRLLFGVDPVSLRRSDHARYLELSRASTGEAMAEVLGDWRRPSSGCRGALVLWLKDMLPGAGLGVLDAAARPKVALHHLRRVLAPVAVWSTDEGVAGVAIHVFNDRPQPLRARLRVSLLRELATEVAGAEEEVEVPAHGYLRRSVEGMLGRFVDAAWAYRFGPPGHDAVVVSLEREGTSGELLSQCVRFSAGRPQQRQAAETAGLEALWETHDALRLRSRTLIYGLRVDAEGFEPAENAFCLEPGRWRTIPLRPVVPDAQPAGAVLSALNLAETVRVRPPPQPAG